MVGPSRRRAGKNVPATIYPDRLSSIAPVSHCPDFPGLLLQSEENCLQMKSLIQIREDQPRREPITSQLQKNVNNLIRDFGLRKIISELLTSKLMQRNLLDESVHTAVQSERHQCFSVFFTDQHGRCFGCNITGLFETLRIACNPKEWRFFVERSPRSVKAMLKTYPYPYLLLAHSVQLKRGEYDCIHILLDAYKYKE